MALGVAVAAVVAVVVAEAVVGVVVVLAVGAVVVAVAVAMATAGAQKQQANGAPAQAFPHTAPSPCAPAALRRGCRRGRSTWRGCTRCVLSAPSGKRAPQEHGQDKAPPELLCSS
jgi:hypothetical protein